MPPEVTQQGEKKRLDMAGDLTLKSKILVTPDVELLHGGGRSEEAGCSGPLPWEAPQLGQAHSQHHCRGPEPSP